MAKQSWEEIAEQIGTTPRTLLEWRKMDGCPQGRNALALDAFAKARGLGRYSLRKNAPDQRAPDQRGEANGNTVDERQLRLRERQIELERAEHKLAEQKRDVLPLKEFQEALRITVSAFDAVLQQLPGRSAEKIMEAARQSTIAMLRDVFTEKQFEKIQPLLEKAPLDHAAVIKLLDHELDSARATLAAADFLNPPAQSE